MNELNSVFDKFRRPLIWTKQKDEWKLRQQITKYKNFKLLKI